MRNQSLAIAAGASAMAFVTPGHAEPTTVIRVETWTPSVAWPLLERTHITLPGPAPRISLVAPAQPAPGVASRIALPTETISETTTTPSAFHTVPRSIDPGIVYRLPGMATTPNPAWPSRMFNGVRVFTVPCK